MGAYLKDIARFARERNDLLQAIHTTFQLREQSPSAYENWKAATRRFHDHRSDLDALFRSCFHASQAPIRPKLRAFMFDYIAADPQFFRSGYMMERILRKARKLPLTADEKRIVQTLLLNRIRTKALRNFRDICRLVPLVQDTKLRAEIEELARSSDPAIQRRARFAMDYLKP